MVKSNLIEIYSCDSEINDDGTLKLSADDIINLRDKGVKNVRLVLFSHPFSEENNKIDKELFQTIVSKQTLPDEVVYEFLQSKGSLAGKNFSK